MYDISHHTKTLLAIEGGTRMRLRVWWFLVAVPMALCLMLFFPATSQAHAMLVQSDPTPASVLTTAPTQVRLWFSEDLNPATSTAYVVNAQNSASQGTTDLSQHVDAADAHIASTNSAEMDLTFKAPLSPDVYVVIYRTQSAEDGHVVHGSFTFTVTEPNGVAPKYSGTLPDQISSSDGSNGQLDGLTLFNLLMITLVYLGTVFWLGAQLWHNFVLRISENQDQIPLYQQVERRFERVFAIPTLLLLLLANIGVLIAEAISLTSYQSGQAMTPKLFLGLLTQGQFGTFWIMREVVVLLALALALYLFFSRQRPDWVNSLHPWLNLILGLALITAITLSGNAAAVNKSLVTYSVLADWLHLLAASLWVGGMFYIATTYQPTIQPLDLGRRTYSLITTLALYSPLVITGVVVLAASGPFSAAVHMDSWTQFLSTAYGRTLIVKSVLVVALLVTSATYMFILCPRLKKSYIAYVEAQQSIRSQQEDDPARPLDVPAQEIKQQEESIQRQVSQLSRVLRWQPLLGVAILLCTGLLNVFAGTLQPAITTPTPPSTQQAASKPFATTLQTQDKAFTVKLSISPNTFGTNVFTVSVFDKNGTPTTNVGVSLYTSSLDMDMGIDKINLQPDGKGHFSANGDISMPGNWEVRVEIRTPDNTLHKGTARFYTPDTSS
jgi:copper transport protein